MLGAVLDKGLYPDPIGPFDYVNKDGGQSSCVVMPLLLAAEAQRAHLSKSYGPSCFGKISKGTCNLHRCTMTALAPRIYQNKIYPKVQLAEIETILNNTYILLLGGK